MLAYVHVLHAPSQDYLCDHAVADLSLFSPLHIVPKYVINPGKVEAGE
jgi:hypothetical protein